ncbi:uncharacterized protein BO88DRAFT_376536 [Aspergillus vadensis CBS 113365]|uniref:Integral membrane protein n=1 Tax=Aspergillus vadensis (strain CBS 113365 / IMI 142717 / IBT 24658) TaxID=1448311 RepID=A0A319ASK9_ASPVC|nr:integral membrane protein [Aspergillus vadensis CBS 113365]PYH63317.1 integral membrane protein [Aspergillus vadensis CBS 113365]
MSFQSISYNAGPGILALNWTAAAIAILVMILRVIAKIRIRHYAVNDTAMLCALVLALAASIMITLAIAHGYGRHFWYLSQADQVLALKYYTGFQCLSIIATGAGRAAFTLYLLNILRQERYLGWILWFVFALQIIINIVSVATILAQCQDIDSLWDVRVSTTCWDPNVERIYGYVQCCMLIDPTRKKEDTDRYQKAINTASDLFLAVFPTYTFWSLSLKLRVKISLVVLMGFGLVAMVASIMRIVHLESIAERGDPTAATVQLTRWALAECYLVIITASMPCIRSLIIASVRNISSGNGLRVVGSQYKISPPIPRRAEYSTWADAPPPHSREYILNSYPMERERIGGRAITKQVDITVIRNRSRSTRNG